jgi:hypothetical protein
MGEGQKPGSIRFKDEDVWVQFFSDRQLNAANVRPGGGGGGGLFNTTVYTT